MAEVTERGTSDTVREHAEFSTTEVNDNIILYCTLTL
jgi:hypothetical protein